MMNEYAILYLEINLLSLVLIWIILHKTAGLSKMVAQRNFAMSIAAEMIFFISDTIFVLLNEGVISYGIFSGAVKLICKELYFFSTCLMCFFWFLYFEYLKDSDFVRDKEKIRVASLIVWSLGIMLLANIFTGFLFYVDKSGVYHRGPYFILTYVLAYVYVLISCVRTIISAFRKDLRSDRKTMFLMTLFPVAPGGAGLLQYVYPRLPVACGVLAITTMILYLHWIDQLISLDPLTGLNNRKHLVHFYEQWKKNHRDGMYLNVMMIDADKFKSINDTYGHAEGDNALKYIAEALRYAFSKLPGRVNIARYGGDEFVVLFETETGYDCKKLTACIREKLTEINTKSNSPFVLSISIGISGTEGADTLKELLERADGGMYEEKRSL